MTAPLKADVTAADRLLKAAVRRAIEELRGYVAMTRDVPGPALYSRRIDIMYRTPGDAFGRAVAMLTAAAKSADLLLADDERPAKKAAARKGASS
jgi:hypothetical protein